MDKEMTFEQAMKRLEEIITLLENNQTSLENSVDLFQEGISLSKICNSKLENIENRVSKILLDGKLETFEVEENE